MVRPAGAGGAIGEGKHLIASFSGFRRNQHVQSVYLDVVYLLVNSQQRAIAGANG